MSRYTWHGIARRRQYEKMTDEHIQAIFSLWRQKELKGNMKRLIMIVLMSIAVLSLVFSGCATSARAFTEPSQIINTGVNQEFVIALGSNPTTGYSWQAAYDEKALTLVEQTYKEQDNTGEQIVGAPGTEYFRFKALRKGQTEVTFTYRRPWEEPSAQDQTLVFTVNVK